MTEGHIAYIGKKKKKRNKLRRALVLNSGFTIEPEALINTLD